MYGVIVLLCLLMRSEALGDATTENKTDERYAKDGVYIGCYPLECMEFHYHPILSQPTTPDSCTASCKENGFKIAALYNRTKCSCSCNNQACRTQLPDGTHHVQNHCGLPCRRELDKFCGGFDASSLYGVKLDDESKINCTKAENITDRNKGRDTPRLSVPIILIFVSVAVFLVILIVSVILIYRRYRHIQEHEEEAVTVTEIAEQGRETINKQLSLQEKVVQNRNSRITNATHYQPLNAKRQGADLPRDNVTAALSPGSEINEVIYEDPDLQRYAAPTAGSKLNHVYLVSGQGVPSKGSASDEYHEYNYPDVTKIKLKAPDRASKVDEDGYLVAKPDLRSLPNPETKVYYCSCIHKSQIGGQEESS